MAKLPKSAPKQQPAQNFNEEFEKKYVPMKVDDNYNSKYGEIKIIIDVDRMFDWLSEVSYKTTAIYLAESKNGTKYFYRWAKKETRASFEKEEIEKNDDLPF